MRNNNATESFATPKPNIYPHKFNRTIVLAHLSSLPCCTILRVVLRDDGADSNQSKTTELDLYANGRSTICLGSACRALLVRKPTGVGNVQHIKYSNDRCDKVLCSVRISNDYRKVLPTPFSEGASSQQNVSDAFIKSTYSKYNTSQVISQNWQHSSAR